MGYLTYYIGWMALTFALGRPWVMAGAILFFVFRQYIPDPVVLLRTWRRIRALDMQVAANPANVTARRDLAEIWLDRMRPGRALELLDEARRRDPEDAELLFLTGLARYRGGNAEGALQPLVEAVERAPRMRFGAPFLVAGQALTALGRYEEAEDALARYVATNNSSIEGYVRLADVRRQRGDHSGARKALDQALETWTQIPGYHRRAAIGWWLRAQAARLWT